MTGKTKLFVIGVCMMLISCDKPAYQGPVSDHFDGKQFSAPEPLPPKRWYTVWKWRLTAKREKWPDWVEYGQHDVPPARVTGKTLRVSFVNHATMLIQTEGLNILTDPIRSGRNAAARFPLSGQSACMIRGSGGTTCRQSTWC